MGNLKNETMKTEDTHFKPKLKLELERQLELDFCFSGSAAEGAALLSPPPPIFLSGSAAEGAALLSPEGGGVWGNRLLLVSY